MYEQGNKPSDAGTLKLLHILEVHQEELRIQNEELSKAVAMAESATALYDFAPTGYFTLEKDGTIAGLNLSGAAMLGKERTSLINSNFKFFISQDNLPCFNDFLDKTIGSDIKQTCEIRLALQGKPSIFVHIEGIASNSGQKCLVTAIDLTAHKESEEALKESAYLFRESQRAAFIGSYKANLVTGYWESSEVLDQIFGIDKCYNKSIDGWLDIVHPDNKNMMYKHLYEWVIPGRCPFDKEYRIVRKSDGETRWVHGLGKIVQDVNGNVVSLIGTIQDITGRKQIEESLKMSETQFKDLFENAHIGIIRSTPDGKILNANRELVRMLGYSSAGELINGTTDISAQIYADPNRRPLIMETLAGNKDWSNFQDVVWRRKDGTFITIDKTVREVLDSDGAVSYFESFIVDITEKLATEHLINQMRQNYETFFNTIDDFLFVLDEKGDIQHMNTTVTDRLGYTKEELTGQSVLLVHPEERRDEAGRIVGEMLMGKSKFCPVPLVTKSGKMIPVETRVKSGTWDGKPAIFGVTKDISQIKLSEEKFSKVFYVNPSACGLNDLETGKYIEVNEAFYSLFGFYKGEVIGKTAVELGIMTDETKKMLILAMDLNGEAIDLEADLRTKSGEVKHVLLSTENIYVQDKKLRYTVVQDITLRKQSEDMLKESEARLRELNATKDKFFSIIGHDLRNPFTAIIGLSNLLAEQIKEKDYDGIEEYANIIQSSSQRAMSLLSDLLDWARLQTGKMTFSPKTFDLVKLIDDVINLAGDTAKQKSIAITKELNGSTFVMADRAMINTILRNLISNALKFSHIGGQVAVSAVQGPNGLTVAIKDNGIGIKGPALEKLFRIETTYSTPGTNKEVGTGLGLLLCKELIEKHNGKIWVESESGTGSTFFFTIPN